MTVGLRGKGDQTGGFEVLEVVGLRVRSRGLMGSSTQSLVLKER